MEIKSYKDSQKLRRATVRYLRKRRKNWHAKKKKGRRNTYSSLTFDPRQIKQQKIVGELAEKLSMERKDNWLETSENNQERPISIARKVGLLADIIEEGVEHTVQGRYGEERDFILGFRKKSKSEKRKALKELSNEYFLVSEKLSPPG